MMQNNSFIASVILQVNSSGAVKKKPIANMHLIFSWISFAEFTNNGCKKRFDINRSMASKIKRIDEPAVVQGLARSCLIQFF